MRSLIHKNVFVPVLLGVVLLCEAASGAEDSRLDGLLRSFMAPCCWRENLAMHQSPRAEELRVEIRNLVRAGMSDAEIRASMVERHTRRILSIPDGATGQWLGWTPIAALLAGLVVVTLFIKKSLAVEAQQRAT